MRVLGKPLQDITGSDLQSLIDNGVIEMRTLEYKRDLPGDSGDERKEFLADVSSLANTNGGTIIYGIDCEKETGIPKEITGVTMAFDQERLRLESIIRDGLDPKLGHIEFHSKQAGEKVVLLLGIPRSLFAPHVVWYHKSGKFYARSSAGKIQMDVREVRRAFLETEDWEREADRFRRERIMSVRSLEAIPNLRIDTPYFIHILPLGRLNQTLDLRSHQDRILEIMNTYNHDRPNLEGYLLSRGTPIRSYMQIFRNGGVEMFLDDALWKEGESSVSNVHAPEMEDTALRCIRAYLALAGHMELSPPFIVFLSLFGMKGGKISFPNDLMWVPRENRFDRSEILLPGVVIDDPNVDIGAAMRSSFDIIWQAAGLEGSRLYNPDGTRRQFR